MGVVRWKYYSFGHRYSGEVIPVSCTVQVPQIWDAKKLSVAEEVMG
jgi:hypothetical protein